MSAGLPFNLDARAVVYAAAFCAICSWASDVHLSFPAITDGSATLAIGVALLACQQMEDMKPNTPLF